MGTRTAGASAPGKAGNSRAKSTKKIETGKDRPLEAARSGGGAFRSVGDHIGKLAEAFDECHNGIQAFRPNFLELLFVGDLHLRDLSWVFQPGEVPLDLREVLLHG